MGEGELKGGRAVSSLGTETFKVQWSSLDGCPDLACVRSFSQQLVDPPGRAKRCANCRRPELCSLARPVFFTQLVRNNHI